MCGGRDYTEYVREAAIIRLKAEGGGAGTTSQGTT